VLLTCISAKSITAQLGTMAEKTNWVARARKKARKCKNAEKMAGQTG
jgi:hypothetical protein